jgi:hypothetical protein
MNRTLSFVAPAGRRRRPPVLLLLGVLGLLLAACSSSGASSTTTTKGSSSGSSPSASNSFSAYRTCLKQHGVTLPNFTGRPPSGGGGSPEGGIPPSGSGTPPSGSGAPPTGSGAPSGPFNNPKFAAAQKACAKLAPKGGFGRGRAGGFGGANASAFAAYTNCLKLHGVTVTNGVPDTSSASFAAASSACAALRPTPGSTTSTTG